MFAPPSPQLLQFQRLRNLRKLSGMFKNYTNNAKDDEEALMKFFVGICFTGGTSGLYEWTGIKRH